MLVLSFVFSYPFLSPSSTSPLIHVFLPLLVSLLHLSSHSCFLTPSCLPPPPLLSFVFSYPFLLLSPSHCLCQSGVSVLAQLLHAEPVVKITCMASSMTQRKTAAGQVCVCVCVCVCVLVCVCVACVGVHACICACMHAYVCAAWY